MKYDDDGLLEIVDIQFTFKHFRLIPLMIERGKAIADRNEVKRLEIEKKILYEYSSRCLVGIIGVFRRVY